MTSTSLNRTASLATLAIEYDIYAYAIIAIANFDSHTRCLVFFVDIANLGMVNIALPAIRKAGYDVGSLQWVLTAYSLTVSSIPTFVSLLRHS